MARLLIGGAVVDADDLVDQRARVQGRHDPCHSHLLVGRPARSPRPTVSHAPGGPASRLTAAGGAHARSRPRRAPSSVCEPSLGEPGGPGRADAGRAHPPRSSRASADQGSGTLEERERRWRLAGRVRFSAGTTHGRRSSGRRTHWGRRPAPEPELTDEAWRAQGREAGRAELHRRVGNPALPHPALQPHGLAVGGVAGPAALARRRAGTPRPFARRVRGTPCPRAGQRVRPAEPSPASRDPSCQDLAHPGPARWPRAVLGAPRGRGRPALSGRVHVGRVAGVGGLAP